MRDKLRKWWRGFVGKQKFAVLDSDDGRTKWYMYISPANLLVGFLSLVVILFMAVVLVVAYTPVMDTIPGYPGSHSRQMLVRGIMHLDSLEREMANLVVYSNNIDMIMEGKTPVIRDVTRMGDSIRMQDKTPVSPIGADSVLRARMEGDGGWSLAKSVAAARAGNTTPGLVPPIKGIVQSEFSPVDGRFGVEIVTADLSPVAAVKDGTVILSVFVPGEGHLVQIQHTGEVVSIYRHLTEALPGVGTRVKAGEVIGMAGPLFFELWNNGRAVDPMNHIVF